MTFEIEHGPLEEMTLEELLQLKKARYKSASDIIKKASFCAMRLGKITNSVYTKYTWETDGIRVFVDDYGKYMTIEQDEHRVVSTHNVAFAIPGRWEGVIAHYYEEAQKIADSESQRQEAVDRENLMRFLV